MATEIIGREEELAELRGFLDAADRVPAAFLMEGEPGIGKTVLWRAGVELARARHFRVLTAIPATAETRLSFAALADLLEPVLADVLPSLPRPQRRALEIALLLDGPPGPAPDPRAVAFAFLTAVRALARGGPVVVAIDDIQWLDGPSASTVEFAIRRLHNEPVVFLLALRSGEERHRLGSTARSPRASFGGCRSGRSAWALFTTSWARGSTSSPRGRSFGESASSPVGTRCSHSSWGAQCNAARSGWSRAKPCRARSRRPFATGSCCFHRRPGPRCWRHRLYRSRRWRS